MNYENLQTDVRGSAALKTGWITLHRPKALNALNDALMDELGAALLAFDADPGIGCIVVTGNEKAFAAGADIAAMAKYSYMDVHRNEYITRNWEPTARSSVSPRSRSASCPGPAARSGCRARWARARRWT
jgi:enoyl-CoA hydratase